MQSDSDNENKFNVYVGSELGILKAIYFGSDEEKPVLKNFHPFETDNNHKKTEIVSLNWSLENPEKELLVGLSNNSVKVYNTKLKLFTQGSTLTFDHEEHGNLVGLYNFESNFIFGTTKGSLIKWNYVEDKYDVNISTGNNLTKLIRSVNDANIYATGGKETELQLWNLNSSKPDVPLFKAKNLPNDFLDLRVPVWVQDITFLPESSDIIAISTRYGQVRLYDTRASNRPTVNMQFLDHPLMAISTASSNNKHVLIGSSQGTMGLIDLRRAKGDILRQFNGHFGSVRSISAHPTLPYFVSAGLDRHLCVHKLSDKEPKKKLYLKSRLTSIIMSKDFGEPENTEGVWQNVSMNVPIELTKLSSLKQSHSSSVKKGKLLVPAMESVPPIKRKKH